MPLFLKKALQATGFVLSTSVLGLLSMITGLFWPRGARWFARAWGKGLCWMAGFRLRVGGLENLPRDGGGFVVASNHQSAADIAVVLAGLPGDVCWVTKASLLKVPFIGWHLRMVHIPVSRAKAGNTAKLLQAGAQKIRDGAMVVIFPEGTRNRAPEHLLPFRKGAFLLAEAAGRPIVPVAVSGSADLMKPGVLLPESGVIDMRIGPPVDPTRFAPGDLEGLAQATRRAVQELLGHPPDAQFDDQRQVVSAAG